MRLFYLGYAPTSCCSSMSTLVTARQGSAEGVTRLKKIFGLLVLLAFLCSALSVTSLPAFAQRGGGGGGPVARHGGRYNLLFDYVLPINGRSPVYSGSYGITTYITTLSLNIRISSCELPDNTPLTVTVYANDYYTGAPWVPRVAGTMTVISRSASLTVSELWTTPAGGLPVISSIVITAPDGTVVASGHP